MPMYHRAGEVPRKRHIAFRQASGALYPEELVGNKGFSGPSALLYHLRRPTVVRSIALDRDLRPGALPELPLSPRHWRLHRLPAGGSPVLDRRPIVWNADVAMSFVQPTAEDPFFFRNAQADEVVYVSTGEGTLETPLGALTFRGGDYLVIPRYTIQRWRLGAGPHRWLVVESQGYVRTPKRYRNEHGQLLEGAPYSERDVRVPSFQPPVDEEGAFTLLVKHRDRLTRVELGHHPFDVVGWDGFYYPWALSIHDFEPIVGKIHQPPPVHQTFEGDGFVLCSFCPRPYDFHPEAVPAPYNHANVMTDEVIYYASSEFMSRKGIEFGSVTLHPDGLAHGPHPGRAEDSLGKPWTDELAVMLDTFRPLEVAPAVAGVEDADYVRSWLGSP